MDSVKRRLVYVADENDILLTDLTGVSPPTPRPSRLSRIHVASSSDKETQSLSVPEPPPSRRVGAAPDGASRDVDPLLLVSYDGQLLADGSGQLHKPRNAIEAMRLRTSLHACSVFLRDYIRADASPDSSTPQTASVSSTIPSSRSHSDSDSSSDGEFSCTCENDADDDDDTSERSSPRRKVHKANTNSLARSGGRSVVGSQVGQPSAGLYSLTVAELKKELRRVGLPISGSKTALVERLCSSCAPASVVERRDGEVVSPASDPLSTPVSSLCPQRIAAREDVADGCAEAHTRAGPELPESPRSESGAEATPNSTRSSRGGLWEAIVNVGSLFFRPDAARTASPTVQSGAAKSCVTKRPRST